MSIPHTRTLPSFLTSPHHDHPKHKGKGVATKPNTPPPVQKVAKKHFEVPQLPRTVTHYPLVRRSSSRLTRSFSVWHSQHTPSLEEGVIKMLKNARKAIEEHRSRVDSNILEAITSPEEGILDQAVETPLIASFQSYEAQGVRSTMEDAHFCKKISRGYVAGLFDGHGGNRVARYAADYFEDHFEEVLTAANGDVRQAFTNIITTIQAHVTETKIGENMGATAVVSFIDSQTHKIYTATLADSEAFIYRKIENRLKAIPLSCVRDWSCPKEAARVAIALNNPEIKIQWTKYPNPKMLRHPKLGLNVSRSLGDVSSSGSKEKPEVLHKAKITMNQMQPGDILILACDGVWDFASIADVGALIALHGDSKSLASEIVDYVIDKKWSTDNVSVLILKV